MLRLIQRNTCLSVLMLGALVTASPAAHAASSDSGLSFDLLGAAVQGSPKITTSSSAFVGADYRPKWGFGGGVGLEFGSGPITFELDGIYLMHKYYDAKSAGVTISQNGIQFPAMLRYTLARLLSLGIGAYYEMDTGDLRDSTGLSSPYAASGWNSSDLGLVASARLNVQVLLLEIRYTKGLANGFTNTSISTNTKNGITDPKLTYSSAQLLVGFHLF